MFAPELQSGEVLRLLEDWILPPLELWAIYPSGRLTSTKARAFIEWLEEIIIVDRREESLPYIVC
jgi:DNA-binding transcriptional LysR family regulator